MTALEKTKRRKKSHKEMISDFLTILTIVLIFAFSFATIIFIGFTFVSSASAASETRTEVEIKKEAAKKFQEAMQYAQTFKNIVQVNKKEDENIQIGDFKFKPQKTFIDPKKPEEQKGWYTNNPTQAAYYGRSAQHDTQQMANDAIAETTKDDNYKDTNGNPVPTPGKSVVSSFQTRPVFKVTKDDEYLVKSNELISNAKGIISGTLSGKIKCKDNTQEVCESIFEQKTCNEEIRTVKKICEKVPQIILIDDPYPGCQRHTSPPAIEDCLAYGVQIPHYRGTGYGRIVLPQKRGARVGFDNSKHPYYYITATNEATGEKVIPRRQVSNGYYIELPVSNTQDQTFSFVVERWEHCTCERPGRMDVYINYMRKIPKIEWKEVSCREI
jgi:hypothetical protein